jgi:hypothetical protein
MCTETMSESAPSRSHATFRYHWRRSPSASASVTLGATPGTAVLVVAARGSVASPTRGRRTVRAASIVISPQTPPSSAYAARQPTHSMSHAAKGPPEMYARLNPTRTRASASPRRSPNQRVTVVVPSNQKLDMPIPPMTPTSR